MAWLHLLSPRRCTWQDLAHVSPYLLCQPPSSPSFASLFRIIQWVLFASHSFLVPLYSKMLILTSLCDFTWLGLLSRIALLSFCPHSFIKRPVKHELLSWTPPAPLLGQFHHPWSCHSTEYNALSTLFCCSVFPPISEELLKCRHCVWFSLGSLEPTHCLSYKRCSQAFHSKKKKSREGAVKLWDSWWLWWKGKAKLCPARFIIPDGLLRGQKPFLSSSLPHMPKQQKGTFEKFMVASKSKWEGNEQSEFNSASTSWAPVLCQGLGIYMVPVFRHLTVCHRLQALELYKMVQGVEWAIEACPLDI